MSYQKLPEKKPLKEPVITEQKPGLIHLVSCKNVGGYCRNQEKTTRFRLEETKQQKIAAKKPNGKEKIRLDSRRVQESGYEKSKETTTSEEINSQPPKK